MTTDPSIFIGRDHGLPPLLQAEGAQKVRSQLWMSLSWEGGLAPALHAEGVQKVGSQLWMSSGSGRGFETRLHILRLAAGCAARLAAPPVR